MIEIEALKRDAVMGVMAANGHVPESYSPATGQAACRYCGMQARAVTEGGRLTVAGEAAERECWEVLVEETKR